MLDALSNLLAPPVLERLTLVLNHVLRAEPAATQRLAPHAGRRIAFELAGWPALLPRPTGLAWRITPPGLLEWCGTVEPAGASSGASAAAGPAAPPPAADLQVTIDAANPAALFARALAGERPSVQIEGDAVLAGEIGWLLQNLRWDVAADLERFFGPVVAHQLHQAGRALARGLRAALDAAASASASASPLAGRLSELAQRFGPGRR